MKDNLVLVTGAAGFLGRYVARFFSAKGYRVIGMGHGSWQPLDQQEWGVAKWHECDIDLDTLREKAGRPGVIIHCAGSGSVGFSLEHPLEDFRRTVETTAHVLEFTRLHLPGAKIVLPSSAGVYGAAGELPIAEDAPLTPFSPYGVHKKAAEDLCRSYSRNFGVASAIVRLFSAYGPGLKKQLLWDACNKLVLHNEATFSGTGNETRDLIHATDAAELLYFASLNASPECPAVNGGSGQGIPVREILSELFLCLKRSDRPQFSSVGRPGDPVHYRADVRRALAWGWRPRVLWKAGIAEYADWYRGQIHA